MKKLILYDGDMGGDDLWAIAMLLAHRDQLDIRAIASVFGNVSQPQAAQNAANFLHWLGAGDIPVIEGANTPCDGMRPFGDDAYGENGIGGIVFKPSPYPIHRPADIADWYAAQLDAAQTPVTILATGPATNLALFAQKYPDKADKIAEIIFMGAAINPPGRHGKPFLMENGQHRIGNITPFAEFNAYQDPKALNILLQSGINLTFMAADASQFMVLTPERQSRIARLDETYGPAFHRMLMAVETLDRTKFGVDGPFIHDPNVVTYLLRPDLYKGSNFTGLHFIEAPPEDDHRGHATNGAAQTRARWLNGIIDPHAVFDLMEKSLRAVIAQASGNQSRPAG